MRHLLHMRLHVPQRIGALCTVLLCTLFGLSHVGMQAQSAEVHYGETVKGTLTANAVQAWSFVAARGDLIVLTLTRTSGNLLASLTLQDQDQQPIVSAQPSAEGGVALSDVRIMQPGAYTIQLHSTASSSGAYTLMLNNGVAPAITVTPILSATSGTIEAGSTVHGQIANPVYEQLWQFKGNTDDVLDIQMNITSGDLSAFVSLISPANDVITSNAGANGQRDAGIFSQQLTFPGTYTIVARRVGDQQGKLGVTSGTYDLTLTVHTPTQSAQDTVIPVGGAPLSGRLTVAAPISEYRLNNGGTLAFRLALNSLHRIARLRIVDDKGALLVERAGISPLLFSTILPDKQPYYVQITSDRYDDQKNADFSLSTYKLRALAKPLRFFETQHGTAGNADDRWLFSGHAGDLVRLNVTPTGSVLNTALVITGPQDVLLFTGNIGAQFDQPLTLPADGLYQVDVQPGSKDAPPADYAITAAWFGVRGLPFERFGVTKSRGKIAFDTPVSGTLAVNASTDGGDTWTFDSNAGQALNVSVSGQTAQQPIGVAVRAPDETLIGVQYGQGVVLLHQVILTHGGRYSVIVFDPTNTANNTYSLQLEDAGGGSLTVNQAVKGVVLPTNALAEWSLDVPAGSLINVQLDTRTPLAWSPGLYVLDPSGFVLTRVSVGAQKNVLNVLGVSAPTTGRYRLLVAGTVAAAFASYQLSANVQTPFGNNVGVRASQSGLSPIARFAPVPDPNRAPPAIASLIEPSLPPEKINAPDVQNLSLNTLLRGEIAVGALRQVWHTVGQTGSTLSIRAVSLTADGAPDLALFDRTGKIVAEQLHGTTADTTLSYHVTQGGDYELSVRMGITSGRYTLYAQSQTLKSGTLTIAPGTPIVYGQSIAGELRAPDQTDAYYFFGANNDLISVQAVRTNGDLIPALQIVTPGGTVLAADSNTSGALSSTLATVRLPDMGVYAVIVRHTESAANTMGRYLLSLGVVSGSRLTNRLSGILSPGQTVTGALIATNNTNTWLLQGHAGERISLVAAALERGAEPTPLTIQLMDTAGNGFASQGVFLPQDAARLADIMLPADGIYRVQVVGGNQTPGGYQLSWLPEAEPRTAADPALLYGQTTGGVFTAAHNADTWAFAGTANDVISVALLSVRGDPFRGGFQLVSANGVVLATAADLGDGGARIDNILLPFSGSYRLIVANADTAFHGAGVYSLSLVLQDSKARAIGGILHDGEQSTGDLYPDDPSDSWLFSGRSGDVITAQVQARDQFLKPTLTLLNTFGQTLATVTADANGLAAINAFKLPADGVYVLTIEGANKSNGGYRIGLSFAHLLTTNADVIPYGKSSVGLVADDRPTDRHQFSGQQGDRITAKVTREPGSALAIVLDLYDEQGVLLARADALGQDDAILSDFSLPATGNYQLVITRYRGVQGITSGRFTVSLNGTPAALSIRGKLLSGKTSSGRLNDATPADRWTFAGQAGQVISVTSKATSGDLDTFLTLQTPDGRVIASNDDFDSTNAVLVGVTLPTDGIYVITLSRVGTSSHGSSGNYDLRADELFQLGKTAAPQAVIGYGQRVVGTVDLAHPETRWTFAANQGDVISVQLIHATDDAPPLLSLQDPAGALLISGKLGIGQTTIDGYRVPAHGYFDVVVKRPADAKLSYAPYAVTLSLIGGATSAPADGGVLQSDDTVIGALSGGQNANLWLLNGSNGQALTLEVLPLSGTLKPSLLLVDPGGHALAAKPVTADGGAIRLESVPLTVNGVYTVIVLPTEANSAGTYRLNARSTFTTAANGSLSAPTLSADQNVQGTLSDIRPTQTWQISGIKGQTLSARMLTTAGTLQPVLQLLSAEGQLLAESRMDRTLIGSVASIDSFVLPADGTYQLFAARMAATSGTYTLSFSTRSLAAQTLAAQTIIYGQMVQGVLQAAKTDLLLFNGKAGDAINLIALAGTTGTVPALTLQDAGGQLLRHADPANNETNIQGFVLPADGRYVVMLDAAKTSAYTLAVQRRQDVLPSSPTGRILVNGVTQQNGILDKNPFDYWTFPGKADSTIQIAAARVDGTLRLDVTLYGPNGYISSATADASSAALTVGPLRLPTDGSYQVVVGRWLGTTGKTTGRYSLLLSAASADSIPPTVTPLPTSTPAAVPNNTLSGMAEQGDAVIGSQTTAYFDAAQLGQRWHFTAQANATAALTLKSESAGLRLSAYLVNDKGLSAGKASTDDSGNLSLEVSLSGSGGGAGRYTLLIMPGAVGQSGRYHFTLSYALAPSSGGVLVSGEFVNGTITQADFSDAWHFTVQAGQRLTIDSVVTSGDLDLELALFGTDGTAIPLTQPVTQSAVQPSAQWFATAPQDSNYTLIVSRKGGAAGVTVGTYQLRVSTSN